MFRINVYGIGLLVAVGIVVNALVRPLLPGKEPAWILVGGTMMILADLFLRARPNPRASGNRWLSGEYGATIAFPAWILGIGLIGYAAAKQFGMAT